MESFIKDTEKELMESLSELSLDTDQFTQHCNELVSNVGIENDTVGAADLAASLQRHAQELNETAQTLSGKKDIEEDDLNHSLSGIRSSNDQSSQMVDRLSEVYRILEDVLERNYLEPVQHNLQLLQDDIQGIEQSLQRVEKKGSEHFSKE